MRRPLAVAAISVVLLSLPPILLGAQGLRLAIEFLYLGLFAVSFNLLFGYAGLLSFGHNASFGLAGYALALLSVHYPGLPLLAVIGLAALLGGALGTATGVICARSRASHLALLTMAVCQVLHVIAIKWRGLTRGDDGLIAPVRALELPGMGAWAMNDPRHVYWLAAGVVALCLAVTWRILRSPLGTSILLLKENEQRAAFIGYHPIGVKVFTFGYSGLLAGVAGALFVIAQGLVSPETLGLALGGEVVFMALVGGTQSFLGPFLGAAVFTLLEDRLSAITEHWPFFIGALFVLVVLFAPRGCVGLLRALKLPGPGRAAAVPEVERHG